MHLIPASNVVANYFVYNPRYKYIGKNTLKDIKTALENSFRKMNMSVAIDTSKEAIQKIESEHTGLFSVGSYGVSLIDRAKLNESIATCFNNTIDPAIKDTYLELMETLSPIA